MSHGGVIYKATVLYKNKEKIYIGPTGWQFKSRFYKHTQSFRSEVESTILSRFIHKIKNIDLNKTIMGDYSPHKPKKTW